MGTGVACAILLAGCAVNVNGKTYGFGDLVGGGSSEAAKNEAENSDGEKSSGGGKSAKDDDGKKASTETLSSTLKPDFHPNPAEFLVAGQATVSVDKHGTKGCDGYVADDPSVVLDLSSSMKNVQISAKGAGVLLAEFDGKYVCDSPYSVGTTPKVQLDEWPAGKVKIYVGQYNSNSKFKATVRVEDIKRPIDLPWKNGLKPIQIAENPKEAIVFTSKTPAEKGWKPEFRCNDGHFHDKPDFAFELTRPLTDIQIDFRSPDLKNIELTIDGPIPDSGRDIPGRCLENVPATMGRMEPGLYVARVGPHENASVMQYSLIITGKDTKRDPKTLPSSFAASVPLEQRGLTGHFPLLDREDIYKSDEVREWLFANAPKQLFVFAKYDLDGAVAKAWGADGGDMPKGLPALAYPKANEPLLVIEGGRVLAADGSIYDVNFKDLADKPSGAVAFPDAARNPQTRWDSARDMKATEDDAVWKSWEKANKDYEACENRINGPANAQIDAIKARPWWQQSQGMIDQINDRADAAIEAQCKPKNLDKKKQDTWLALMNSRTTRRTAQLGRVKGRVADLFK
jgi:hypothetical protein